MLKAEITKLRNRIDEIDENIAKLLSERVDCAVKIGKLKDKLTATSEKEKVKIYDPIREKEILDHLKAKYPSVSSDGIDVIFRQIISFCRNSAHKSTVCILGETSKFDYRQHLGFFCDYIICSNFHSFVTEMNKNKFNIGVVIGDIAEISIQNLENSGFELIDSFESKSNTIQVYTLKNK